MNLFETVKAAVTPRMAAERYGLPVRQGNMICCPFHDDRTPSMKLNEDYFYCFGCGASGDVIDLVARLFGLSSYDAAKKLAELLDADMLIILTAVEKVAINFNKPDQKGLDDLTPSEAYKYMEENQFAKGSMLPKVQAAVKFAESKAGRTALITLLEKAKDGIEGKTGTRIHQ